MLVRQTTAQPNVLYTVGEGGSYGSDAQQQSIPKLLEDLENPDPFVHEGAAKALGNRTFESKAVQREVINNLHEALLKHARMIALHDNQGLKACKEIAKALGAIGTNEALSKLYDALSVIGDVQRKDIFQAMRLGPLIAYISNEICTLEKKGCSLMPSTEAAYEIYGELGFDQKEQVYFVNGYDSAEPRNKISIKFSLGEINEILVDNPRADQDINSLLAELVSSSSIVLIHERSFGGIRKVDIEVQWDRR